MAESIIDQSEIQIEVPESFQNLANNTKNLLTELSNFLPRLCNRIHGIESSLERIQNTQSVLFYHEQKKQLSKLRKKFAKKEKLQREKRIKKNDRELKDLTKKNTIINSKTL